MEHNKYKRYSKEEDLIILRNVRKNPGNLTAAFKQSAFECGREWRAIHWRWYNVLSIREKGAVTGSYFSLIGKNAYTVNRKNMRIGVSPQFKEVRKNLFDWILRQIRKL